MTEPQGPAPAAPSPAAHPSPKALLVPLRLPAILLAGAFAAFFLARLGVLILHRDTFADLTASQVLRAFLRGFRFDAAAIFPIVGIPLFLILLPVGGVRRSLWRRVWAWVSFGLVALLVLTLCVDVIYFGHVQRHAGLEATEPGDALRVMSMSAVVSYLLPLLAYIVLVAFLAVVFRRMLRRDPPASAGSAAQAALALGFAVLLYFGERGTFSGKRLRVVHAFQDVPAGAGHLALNGPYCILHSMAHSRAVKTAFYPWPDALHTAREALFSPGEEAPDPEYPLLRRRAPKTGTKPNIVILLLESWDASATDVHRREMGMPPLGCTPCYDAASREGILYSRFYACGQRSMDGLSAMLCGFPTIPGTPYIGRGLEQSSLTALGHLAKTEGYDPWFIMSAERDSFRIDAIAAMTGFDHYLGAEDIPPASPAESRAALRGACWDHEMFVEANRRLAAAKRPFLALLYTSSTHHPFYWAGERWNRHPGTTLESRYLNSLEYGDWALGRFFEAAKASDWFANTIFVVTADHIGGPGYGLKRDEPATLHHTPCFIIAPGLRPGVERRTASQLDLLPTVADLAGWGAPQAALGTSLLSDPASGRGALCVQGDLVLRVEDGGFVLHSLESRVQGSGDVDAIERRLLSVTQAAYTLLRSNRLARRP
ncbi:MAG TPA: LTA synthase family protein [Planctomycetota bacterium]|nr:LTA synthase family protein [Planctomycetota bacterium]